MSVSRGDKYKVDPETQEWDDYVYQTMAKEQEGMEAAQQEGLGTMSAADEAEYDEVMGELVSLDQHELLLDHVGIYEKDDPVYARVANERVALEKRLDNLGKEKKKTRKLKKSSRGHSRYGRGGGTIPMDVLESKTAPRGLLGPRKRKY